MKGDPRVIVGLVLIALAGPALPLVADQQSPPTVRHHRVEEPSDDPAAAEIAQAEAAMQQHDYIVAEESLKKAVTINPQSYQAWFDLGYVFNATRRRPDAIDAYRKSIAAKSDVFESNLNLGILLAKQGELGEAARYLSAATQLKPTAEVNEGLARAWLSLGLVDESSQPQESLAAYEQAAKLTPKDPEPHLSAGLLLEKQGKLDDAAREYQAAAALDPKATDPVAGLANVYIKQKKLADAEAQLHKLIALDQGNAIARSQLNRVLAAEGKSDNAVTPLTAEDCDSPNDPRAALECGTASVKAGNYSAAEDQLRTAVRGLPQDPEAHFALGSVLMQLKQYPESQDELILAARLKPDVAEVYGNLAVVAAENKNYKLAIKALDERAKYLPEIPATYFLRATSYDYLKVTAKAVENYKQFLAADGGKMPNQEWQARHRLIAIDPGNASKYAEKK